MNIQTSAAALLAATTLVTAEPVKTSATNTLRSDAVSALMRETDRSTTLLPESALPFVTTNRFGTTEPGKLSIKNITLPGVEAKYFSVTNPAEDSGLPATISNIRIGEATAQKSLVAVPYATYTGTVDSFGVQQTLPVDKGCFLYSNGRPLGYHMELSDGKKISHAGYTDNRLVKALTQVEAPPLPRTPDSALAATAAALKQAGHSIHFSFISTDGPAYVLTDTNIRGLSLLTRVNNDGSSAQGLVENLSWSKDPVSPKFSFNVVGISNTFVAEPSRQQFKAR